MAIIFAEVKTRFSLPLFFFPKTLKTKKLPKNDEETKEINLNLNDEKILPEKNEELEKIDSNLNDEKSNVGVMKQMWIDTKITVAKIYPLFTHM